MAYFVIITGASSGIGRATCHLLIQHGYEVIAGVRSPADADSLRTAYGEKVHPLILDVTDELQLLAARKDIITLLQSHLLVAIINNAGIAASGAIRYIPMEEWKKVFEVNVFGVIRIIQVFFDLLLHQPDDPHPRRIINMSSVSGLFASPFMGPYVTSKFALEALSDSLRRELFMHKVDVVLIEPGSIHTPMWDKAKEAHSYLNEEYDRIRSFKERIIQHNLASALPVEKVANVVLNAVRNKQVRNRYLVKSGAWKFKLLKRLPDSWVDKMIKRTLRKKTNVR